MTTDATRDLFGTWVEIECGSPSMLGHDAAKAHAGRIWIFRIDMTAQKFGMELRFRVTDDVIRYSSDDDPEYFADLRFEFDDDTVILDSRVGGGEALFRLRRA